VNIDLIGTNGANAIRIMRNAPVPAVTTATVAEYSCSIHIRVYNFLRGGEAVL
jgi:hypothetical protein